MKNKNKNSAKSFAKNYYEILDVEPGCSHNDILHAYNKGKAAFSGDALASYSLLDDGENENILEEIEEAFAVLGHPSKRREYDLACGLKTWSKDKKNKKKKSFPKEGARIVQSHLKVASEDLVDSFESNVDIASPAELSFDEVAELRVVEPKEERGKIDSFPVQKELGIRANFENSSFEANKEFESEIENVQELTGDFLRTVRIYRQLSSQQVGTSCKLSARIIELIENEDIVELSYQPVYLRGHINMICQVLDFPNPHQMAKTYIDKMRTEGKLSSSQF